MAERLTTYQEFVAQLRQVTREQLVFERNEAQDVMQEGLTALVLGLGVTGALSLVDRFTKRDAARFAVRTSMVGSLGVAALGAAHTAFGYKAFKSVTSELSARALARIGPGVPGQNRGYAED